jgi:synaptobrevin family protein YKT6
MTLYSILIIHGLNYHVLKESFYLKQWSFLTRMTIKEYLRFASSQLALRTDTGGHNFIKYQPENLDMTVHAYCQSGMGKYVVIITDESYKKRLVARALEEIFDNVNDLDNLIKRYNQPDQWDKIEKELNDTREILLDDISKLVERQENISNLVEKTEEISFVSKAFMKKSKDLNRCCVII